MMDSVPVSAVGSKATSLQPQQGVPYDLESGFEPQTRARSHTWPLPSTEEYESPASHTGGKDIGEGIDGGGTSQQGNAGPGTGGLLPVKKNSSRRNAWGNHSYAELITQAIMSAPDERLTLSQIYEWMMQNIPYFREKGESNSSAGWKNSIRHNLSLHNRFMRVQNEGTGKSSWWMINRDAKPGKPSRRRATTINDGKDDKRRQRIKRKIEVLKNSRLQIDPAPSPSNSVSEGLDLFPDSPLQAGSGYQLSPDFRPRASSNASSCGRLSPIPAIPGKPDWTPTYQPSYSPDQLAGNLAETMKLESYQMYQAAPQNHHQPTAPPSYYEAQYQRSNSFSTGTSSYTLPTRCAMHGSQPCTCPMNLSPVAGMSPSYQQSEPSATALGTTALNTPQTLQYMIQTQQVQQCQQQQQQQQQQPQPPPPPPPPQQQQAQTVRTGSTPPQTPTPCGSTPSTMMGQLMGALNNPAILDDLNINIESLHGGFACNVDEVIKHELLIDDTLDFNFSQSVMGTAAAIPVNDGTIDQNGNPGSQNNGLVAAASLSNTPTGVYVNVSTNAATPAAPPSWVH